MFIICAIQNEHNSVHKSWPKPTQNGYALTEDIWNAIFLSEIHGILIQIWLKIVPNMSNKYDIFYIEIMACRPTGKRSVSQTIIT